MFRRACLLAALLTVVLVCVAAVVVASAGASGEEAEATKPPAPPAESEQDAERRLLQRKAIEESPFFFELPARSGNKSEFNFADAVIDHNLVLFFWSASCPLCLLETSVVNELAWWAEEHPAANLEVISINLDVLGPRVLEESAVRPEIEFAVFYDPGGNRTRKGYSLDEHGLPAFYFFLQGGLPVRVLRGFSSELVKCAKESFLPRPPQVPTPPLTETARR